MEQLVACTFFVALFGGVYDFLTNRIPNWWTFPAMALGTGLHVYFNGLEGLIEAGGGILLGLGIYLPIYLFGMMGAGDVKLLMAVGAFGGTLFVFYVAALGILVGGVYAIIDIIFVGRFVPFFKAGYRTLKSILLRGLIFQPPDVDKERKFSFGISLAVATGLVIWLRHTGRIA